MKITSKIATASLLLLSASADSRYLAGEDASTSAPDASTSAPEASSSNDPSNDSSSAADQTSQPTTDPTSSDASATSTSTDNSSSASSDSSTGDASSNDPTSSSSPADSLSDAVDAAQSAASSAQSSAASLATGTAAPKVAFSKIDVNLGDPNKNLNVETKDDGTVEMNYHKDDGSKIHMTALNHIVNIKYTLADNSEFTYTSDGENFTIKGLK